MNGTVQTEKCAPYELIQKYSRRESKNDKVSTCEIDFIGLLVHQQNY